MGQIEADRPGHGGVEDVRLAEACVRLVRALVETANRAGSVTLEGDFGGNTLTVRVGTSHTHAGSPDGDLALLAGNVADALTGGPGLSWAR